ncbi:MAG: MFS transporter [Ignavibacteriaceae bacterium]|jgi:multidrug resistance protein|nr:MFS transporter [Ignavibacteria bacterium]MCC6884942.1 MFS transporter [Ignavibacteriales bacterium]MEB2329289.1 MFS transporter [Ignavibacteriaceae bacterium]
MKKKNPALLVIFITIFIDLLGFGIIIPLLPFFSVTVLELNESMIGLIAGIYSLMQFFFTPIWGSLSDRYGRKPILIISLIGSVISNILLGLVFSGIMSSMLLLLLSRAFAGIFAANISAAQAVISDVTTAEERTKGMGLIGAAFALGFVFGPAVGGVLAHKFGFGLPVFFAAALSLIALAMAIFIFKESLPAEIIQRNRANKKIKSLDVRKIIDVIVSPKIGYLVIISFFIIFAYSNIFGTFQLFAERRDGLALSEAQIGYLFSFLGIMGSFVQLVFLRLFKHLFGDERSLIIGIFLSIFGLGLIGYSTNIPVLLIILFILAFGNGINNTIPLSLISQNIGSDEQGSILGVNQSLGSLARFFGPVWGGVVYEYLGYKAPFITGGAIMLLLTFYTIRKYQQKTKFAP